MCLEISLRLIPRPYMPIIFCSRLSARIVSPLRINSGSKVELRSLGVSTVTVPEEVRTSLLVLPFFRLPERRSSVSRWLLSSASNAESKKLFSKGAKAPSYRTVICPNAIAPGLFVSFARN